MKKLSLLLCVCYFVWNVDCGRTTSYNHYGTQSHRSRGRHETTAATEEEQLVLQMKRVVLSVNKFSNRLYNVMNEYKAGIDSGESDLESGHGHDEPSGEDLVYSPLTVFTSLAALRSGAGGDTSQEMGNILSLSKVNETVLEKGLGLVLNSIEIPTEKGNVNLVNRLFLDHGFHPNENYVNLVKDQFYGELVQTHFSNATGATTFVNEHMYSASHGLLQEILAVDHDEDEEEEEQSTTEMSSSNGTVHHHHLTHSIDGGLMLVSGFTLEGDWERGFTPLLTKKRVFTREDGSSVQVDMMHRDGVYYYAEIPELNATAVSIPYRGHRYIFTVILPEEGTLVKDVEENLESFPFPAVLSRLKKQHVQLSLPKFQVETSVDLIEPLEQLGIRRVFRDGVADLRKLAKGVSVGELYLTNAVHKTFLDVSEGGSRVPSANFIEAVPAMARHLTPFTVDRPFIFFISDQLLQTVLVVGRKAL